MRVMQGWDVKKIKLIIWDLDNTFWQGTISEGEVSPVKEYIEAVKELSRRGVVNSICSKNDYETCKEMLTELGVWEYFVFPSIDWSAKGNRVLQIVADMNLRTANTVFLDDEPANRQAVMSRDSSIMCATAEEAVPEIIRQMDELPIDETFARLHQYKELQTKVEAKRGFDSDEEFLQKSDIRVFINTDCKSEIDRICELIGRTNQLNYTKLRASRAEVEQYLSKEDYACMCIECADKYCNYGLVGFICLDKKKHTLVHFLFSCRVIGMGVEQFLYDYLNYPKLTVVGEVATQLQEKKNVPWIRIMEHVTEAKTDSPQMRILIKGPCDVSQMAAYFAQTASIDTEFAYVSAQKKGMYVESFNHTSQILRSQRLTAEEKADLCRTIPFIDEEYFSTAIFSKKYDYVIYSLLTDYGLGLYQNCSDPTCVVAFGQYTVDYTKEENWNNIIRYWFGEEEIPQRVVEEYAYFRTHYKYIGRVSDEAFIKNLQEIRDMLPRETKLILLNGAERPYEGECKKHLIGREKLHIQLNRLAEKFVQSNPETCVIIDVNQYLPTQDPYLDTINHYKKSVYFHIATAISEYIAYVGGAKLRVKSLKWLSVVDFVHKMLRRGKAFVKRIIRK